MIASFETHPLLIFYKSMFHLIDKLQQYEIIIIFFIKINDKLNNSIAKLIKSRYQK